MPAYIWEREIAEAYDFTSVAMFDPTVLDPCVEFLEAFASGAAALEFGIGTGRVALPLSQRGVRVSGIDLSPHMVDQLKAKRGADQIHVVTGDMTTTRLAGSFKLVYIVWNAITSVTTQDEQLAVVANAAAHLDQGGHFVVEVVVPQLPRLPPGEPGRVFTLEEDHIGIETFDDAVGQVSWSHHWMHVDGRLIRHSAPYRQLWPSELDLMCKMAGLRLTERCGNWSRQPFTADSLQQIAVYEKVA
jgi:SAM-dependent methyltransferase